MAGRISVAGQVAAAGGELAAASSTSGDATGLVGGAGVEAAELLSSDAL